MSARTGGRLAALPPAGYRPTPRQAGDGTPVVQFVPEDPASPARMFDFSTWPVGVDLQRALAAGFAWRTRPGGPLRAVRSAERAFRVLRSFATYLGELNRPPSGTGDLVPAHLQGWFLARCGNGSAPFDLSNLKSSLRCVPGLTAAFSACLNERNPPRRASKVASYSRGEFTRVLNAARRDVRQAARRVRDGRELLRRWRAGELDNEPAEVRQRGRLLDFIDRHDDVPRIASGVPEYWIRPAGGMEPNFAALHLTGLDATAFVVLLVGLTGQNLATIADAPAAHHRADGYASGPGTAVVEFDKPRRGARRHMDYALVDVPQWLPAPAGDSDAVRESADLRSPFGVYMLLHELAAPARQRLGSDKLIAWWAPTGGAGAGRGFRTRVTSHHVVEWSRMRGIAADPPSGGGPAQPLSVTLQRLRLTFNELHQRPVAHTEKTLVNEYLVRNRGNLGEYQRVVADALTREVAKATTRAAMATLSPAEVAEAAEHPARVAARYGMDAQTLTRLLAGQLDTVMGGCIDNISGPHNPGRACRASFMLCLSCPCARATPQHLPIQVLVHDQLAARRAGMTPLRWTQRFALPHAQLADLLERAGPTAVADARAAASQADRDLVDRFLHRELDLP